MEHKENLEQYFKDEINMVASREEEQILKEVEEIKERAMVDIKDEAKRNADMLMEQELSEMRSDSAIALSRVSGNNHRLLIAQREKYANAVFEEAAKKIKSFVDGDEYPAYLINKIKKCNQQHHYDHAVLYVRLDDMKLKDDITSAYESLDDVLGDKTIQLGGFRLECREAGIVIDETLDQALAAQKEWFYDNSLLMLQADE